jgi:hypothetical protein
MYIMCLWNYRPISILAMFLLFFFLFLFVVAVVFEVNTFARRPK